MEEKSSYLKPEDYLEPECVLCSTPEGIDDPTQTIPQQRISEKIDELMGKKDFNGTERLLRYWLEEADKGKDVRGKFFVYNEMMGFYRQRGNSKEAYKAINN
ncbi:MAG: hypothetical protein IJM15_05610, partial [Erysipelotrichaceae bacterium]|nr:hypothetical protein [Erysipelotrichaceae bacterium]